MEDIKLFYKRLLNFGSAWSVTSVILAYGYRNINNLRTAILFFNGNLDLNIKMTY